jgi:hypothetical protein
MHAPLMSYRGRGGAQKKGEKVSNKGAPIYHFMGMLLKICPPALCQTNTAGLVFNGQLFRKDNSFTTYIPLKTPFFSDLDLHNSWG